MSTQAYRSRVFRYLWAILVLAAFGLGYLFRGGGPAPAPESPAAPQQEASTLWTCAMHPQIRQPQPGQCPICGMDLIPVPVAEGGATEAGEAPRLKVSEAAKALMQLETSPVERRFAEAAIRMVGKVAYDETRVATISAWVPGRLQRLYIDYTGIKVRQGDHMADLYSPELLAAQEELRRAVGQMNSLAGSVPEALRSTARSTVDAARRKLELWGLKPDQIARAEKTGSGTDLVTIYAPLGGTVVNKMATEGSYVETGTPIYTIADLSTVWVKLDAYESDLPWVRYGQRVTFEAEAYPGQVFEGRIAFIDPVIDEMTRTAKVRVNVRNPDGKLLPEMFVRAQVRAQVAAGGRVFDPNLSGKWVSPMHPEIIKDGPGTCDICGMPLVRAEDLGYVAPKPGKTEAPLVIPATAPLITGKRAVVYVEAPGGDMAAYEGREVVLGPRAGNYYIVAEGLHEGERVVTHGAFKIDSALQIQAKPSMMSPEGGSAASGHAHAAAADSAAPGGAHD